MKNTKIITTALLVALAPFAVLAEPAAAQKEAPSVPAEKKTSTPIGWTDDFEAAKKRAAEEGKDLLVAFSGSDWCGWCIRLEKEVFSQKGFTETVSEFLVPVYIDNPSDESRLSELGKKQNSALTERYRIKGFPSVLLMDPEGNVFAETGYEEGGPEKYISRLKKISEEGKNAPRYKVQKEIANIPQGPDRAKQLDALLAAMPLDVQIFNSDYIREILDADPDGKLGFRAKYPYFTTVLPIENEFRLAMIKFSKLADEAVKAQGSPKEKQAMMIILTAVLKENLGMFEDIRIRAESAKKLFPAGDPAARPLLEILMQIRYMTQTANGQPITPPSNAE